MLRLIYFLIYKSTRYLCPCLYKTKSDEVHLQREEIQKERDCRGIDAWSEDFFAEQQVDPLKDLWDRYIIEKRIAEDI